jgi:gamma-glutamylcyclotransferase (GGCT)/AIG2-like uncharacterized protein YtfP
MRICTCIGKSRHDAKRQAIVAGRQPLYPLHAQIYGMSEPGHLFVYGTLRYESEHPMARRLRMKAPHVGKGSVAGLLYDLGSYPAAVFDANEKRRIVGDVFKLLSGSNVLADMDTYESIDPQYKRTVLKVKLANGGAVDAWAYGVVSVPQARLIADGDFIAHRNRQRPRAVRP